MCRIPPPPPPVWDLRGTCATIDFGGAPKKKVSESPPPPPPRFGTCATIDFGGAPKKSVRVPPPPPLSSFFGTCATLDAGGAPKKRVSEPPPPPPPPRSSAFLGLARLSRLAAVREKNSVVPPLFENPGSAPAPNHALSNTIACLSSSGQARAQTLTQIVHLMEYCLVTGYDWWDLLPTVTHTPRKLCFFGGFFVGFFWGGGVEGVAFVLLNLHNNTSVPKPVDIW